MAQASAPVHHQHPLNIAMIIRKTVNTDRDTERSYNIHFLHDVEISIGTQEVLLQPAGIMTESQAATCGMHGWLKCGSRGQREMVLVPYKKDRFNALDSDICLLEPKHPRWQMVQGWDGTCLQHAL